MTNNAANGRSRRLFGWLLVVGLLLGCLPSCEDEPDLVEVQGRIYYQGKPLTGGTIVFTPNPDRGGHGPLANSIIESDGSYSLKTGEHPGAVPGWHRVTIASRGSATNPDRAVPPKYMDPERSGQHWEVKPNQPNRIDIYLE